MKNVFPGNSLSKMKPGAKNILDNVMKDLRLAWFMFLLCLHFIWYMWQGRGFTNHACTT